MPSIWKQDRNGKETRLMRVTPNLIPVYLQTYVDLERAKGRSIRPNAACGFTVFRHGKPYRHYFVSYESGSHDERSGSRKKPAK